jgi:hypothetical protein
MKQFEANGHRCLVVDVPEDGSKTEIYIEYDLMYFLVGANPWDTIHKHIKLPPGNWQIVGAGTVDKITKEEAEPLVETNTWYDGPQEQHGLGMVRYYREYPKELEESCLLSSVESLHSLLKSQGYDNLSEIVLLTEKI